jgi:asparagine synthase (glutamine-hydrolysing)
MCGIAGVFDFNGRAIDARALLAMSDAQAHRGPDGKGVMFVGHDGKLRQFATARAQGELPAPDGAVGGLAHRRLSIIDLSDSGAQPMSDASGECWITFNGEIYNYLELRAELAQRG